VVVINLTCVKNVKLTCIKGSKVAAKENLGRYYEIRMCSKFQTSFLISYTNDLMSNNVGNSMTKKKKKP
jgi:hypothetical protein